ncbi:hypothetical protein BRYFOR_08915 [Marvinbryantia formatexigens DSM 14469]|uniref:Uncharacterized protein n=1 Tax=Marvinbryantia formatexigens DSM 14469 TaxID=478749 RepID=C6LJS8_9FIRM|nr:hypothetical protein BRYFOR_08915 [Marvinbryantia formatexigens DSM 14469]
MLAKRLECNDKLCYSKHKEEQPPTKWLTSRFGYKPTQTGQVQGRLIFIFACFSYLCRQAVLLRIYRMKSLGKSLRIQTFHTTSLLFQVREAPHPVTRLSASYIITYLYFVQLNSQNYHIKYMFLLSQTSN